MYKQIIGAAALSVSLLIGQPIVANAHGGGHHYMLKMHMKDLNLTEKQKDKAREIKATLKKDMQEQAKAISGVSAQIKKQITSTHWNKTKFNQLVDRKAKIIGEMIRLKGSAQHQFFMSLNAEQQKTYIDKMNKRQAKIEKHMKEYFSDQKKDKSVD